MEIQLVMCFRTLWGGGWGGLRRAGRYEQGGSGGGGVSVPCCILY